MASNHHADPSSASSSSRRLPIDTNILSATTEYLLHGRVTTPSAAEAASSSSSSDSSLEFDSLNELINHHSQRGREGWPHQPVLELLLRAHAEAQQAKATATNSAHTDDQHHEARKAIKAFESTIINSMPMLHRFVLLCRFQPQLFTLLVAMSCKELKMSTLFDSSSEVAVETTATAKSSSSSSSSWWPQSSHMGLLMTAFADRGKVVMFLTAFRDAVCQSCRGWAQKAGAGSRGSQGEEKEQQEELPSDVAFRRRLGDFSAAIEYVTEVVTVRRLSSEAAAEPKQEDDSSTSAPRTSRTGFKIVQVNNKKNTEMMKKLDPTANQSYSGVSPTVLSPALAKGFVASCIARMMPKLVTCGKSLTGLAALSLDGELGPKKHVSSTMTTTMPPLDGKLVDLLMLSRSGLYFKESTQPLFPDLPENPEMVFTVTEAAALLELQGCDSHAFEDVWLECAARRGLWQHLVVNDPQTASSSSSSSTQRLLHQSLDCILASSPNPKVRLVSNTFLHRAKQLIAECSSGSLSLKLSVKKGAAAIPGSLALLGGGVWPTSIQSIRSFQTMTEKATPDFEESRPKTFDISSSSSPPEASNVVSRTSTWLRSLFAPLLSSGDAPPIAAPPPPAKSDRDELEGTSSTAPASSTEMPQTARPSNAFSVEHVLKEHGETTSTSTAAVVGPRRAVLLPYLITVSIAASSSSSLTTMPLLCHLVLLTQTMLKTALKEAPSLELLWRVVAVIWTKVFEADEGEDQKKKSSSSSTPSADCIAAVGDTIRFLMLHPSAAVLRKLPSGLVEQDPAKIPSAFKSEPDEEAATKTRQECGDAFAALRPLGLRPLKEVSSGGGSAAQGSTSSNSKLASTLGARVDAFLVRVLKDRKSMAFGNLFNQLRSADNDDDASTRKYRLLAQQATTSTTSQAAEKGMDLGEFSSEGQLRSFLKGRLSGLQNRGFVSSASPEASSTDENAMCWEYVAA